MTRPIQASLDLQALKQNLSIVRQAAPAVRSVVPDAIIMIDNTWAAGVLFKALDFGINVSIQAATKYLVGHSDAMIGTAVCNARCWEQLRENAYLMGQMVAADTAYITSRGLRTLGVRLRQHHESSAVYGLVNKESQCSTEQNQ